MNIIYKNDTLFVDMDEVMDKVGIEKMKRKVFGIVNNFEVSSVVINSGGNNRSNKRELNAFLEEYKENYDGNIIIN